MSREIYFSMVVVNRFLFRLIADIRKVNPDIHVLSKAFCRSWSDNFATLVVKLSAKN